MQGWRIGRIGRSDPHQLAGARREARQPRRQQPHLAAARLAQQQLGQPAGGPAAAGQLGVEIGEAAGAAGQGWRGELIPLPQHRAALGAQLRQGGGRDAAAGRCGNGGHGEG